MRTDRASLVVTKARACELATAWRAAGERVVLAEGVFDLLDAGLARRLTRARGWGARLIVAVHGDRAAASLAGPGRPVLPAADRARLVAALRPVDLVVELGEPGEGDALAGLPADARITGIDRDASGGAFERVRDRAREGR